MGGGLLAMMLGIGVVLRFGMALVAVAIIGRLR